jgi:motility quorum-sensing regulator/GCU-specific mRNA interferase toxin
VEKGTPHSKLTVVKSLVQAGKVRATTSAERNAAAMDFDFVGIVRVVMTLTANDFYKSMTTYADHRIWQDVYRPTTGAGRVYLKLTVVDDVLVVSLKEL